MADVQIQNQHLPTTQKQLSTSAQQCFKSSGSYHYTTSDIQIQTTDILNLAPEAGVGVTLAMRKLPISAKQPRPERMKSSSRIQSSGKGKLMFNDDKRCISGTEIGDICRSHSEEERLGEEIGEGEKFDPPAVNVSTKKPKATNKRKRTPSLSSCSKIIGTLDPNVLGSHIRHVSPVCHPAKKFPLSPSQNNGRHRGKKRRNVKHRSQTHSRKSRDTPPLPQFPIEDLLIPQPPSQEINMLLKSLIVNKDKDMDIKSKVSSVSKSSRGSVIPNRDYTKEDYLRKLPKEIQTSDLAVETVEYIMYRFPRWAARSAGIKYISYVPNNSKKESDLKIDTLGYLLSPLKMDFGYDCQTINNNRDLVDSSLYNALSPLCRIEGDSLDGVFRKALKEIASEQYDYEANGNLTLDNPIFISGRYLELRLLDKIRKYYLLRHEEDIVEYFTKSYKSKNQKKLPGFVEGCTSEMYIRVLHDRYRLNGHNFQEKLKEALIPQNMRVWTNHNHQDTVNMKISCLLWSIRNNVLNSCVAGQEKNKFREKFYKSYKEKMQVFIDEYDTFLSQVLRSSELMAWMCFGITMNDVLSGIQNMAYSYMFVMNEHKLENTNSKVCWNYPLASMYTRALPMESALPYELFSWGDLDKELEKEYHVE